MNILLTGSNGFVGTYFKNKYNSDYTIIPFSFLNDSLDELDLSGINVIVHLSALVHQMTGASKKEYEKVNVIQTIELAKKAKKANIKQFIFMSTIKVYGEETNIKYTENSLCNPKDEYGKSKLKAEKELLRLETESFKISIIRTPIIYGYDVKANIKSLIDLIKKVPILPFKDIKNNRSMIYIGNITYLIAEVIKHEKSGIFLACDDSPLSTTRLIELISKSMNKKTYLIKIPFFETLLKLLKPSFHNRLYGSLEIDNSITKERLNLKNPYSIELGIEKMIKGIDV